MTRIAHLSDLHLLEDGHRERRGLERLRLAYLTVGRENDAARRRARARAALEQAHLSGADHLVVTGDLTEDGVDAQFDVLAAVLAESRWSPSRVTLLPGNHDAYAGGDGFSRALAGPLRAYAPTSTPGAPLHLGDLELVPVSTARAQSFTRSAGAIDDAQLRAIATAAAESKRRGRALVIAQHHPPRRHVIGVLNWIDGLAQHAEVTKILHDHDHAHVLHGHVHVAIDARVRPGGAPRIFATEAVVDGREPLRLYEAVHAQLRPVVEPNAIGWPCFATG